GGLGVRRGAPDRDVIVMVGDGSYLMLHTELVPAVAEGLKIIVVLIQNHGYASIGSLSEETGSGRFGTQYRRYDTRALNFQNEQRLPIDLAANARSYGVDVIEVAPDGSAVGNLNQALATPRASATTTLTPLNLDT